MGKKDSFEDDGRTIADMSGVERQPLLLPNLGPIRKMREERKAAKASGQKPEYFESSDDKETRKAYVGGAIGATLLIALVYLGAFALLVVILLLIWGIL